MMARGDSLMCSRNPGSNYKSGLIAPKRIPTSVPTTRQQNNKSFMRCRSGKARWRTTRSRSGAGTGCGIELMLYAGNSLGRARAISDSTVKHRPRIRLTIRQRTRVLDEWPRR